MVAAAAAPMSFEIRMRWVCCIKAFLLVVGFTFSSVPPCPWRQ
jgi:hypothetical protein